MRKPSKLTLSLALVGLVCSHPVMASDDGIVPTQSAGNKGHGVHFNQINTTVNTVDDDGQNAPPPPDNEQNASPPTNTDNNNDGSDIKWAPQTSDDGMSL